MTNLGVGKLVLAATVLGAAAGCAGSGAAPATISTTPGSLMNLARPQYLPTRFHSRDATTSSQGIQYHGGPVLTHPKVYLIFWGYKTYGDPDKVAALLTAYVKAMGGSGHNNIYTQYYEQTSGQKIYITNLKMQLAGVWFDQTNKVPQSPTDAEVAAEALAGATHFGGNGASDLFVVATPHGRSTSGFGTQWCAYHSAAQMSGPLAYINLPYMPDSGDNCGANVVAAPEDESNADEGVTIVTGAEEGDAVTDPVSGSGWFSSGGGEISDSCMWADIQNDKFHKKSYTMGPMFSNASLSCVQTYK